MKTFCMNSLFWEIFKNKLHHLGKYLLGTRSYLGDDKYGFLSVWVTIIWEYIHLVKYPTAISSLYSESYFPQNMKYFLSVAYTEGYSLRGA